MRLKILLESFGQHELIFQYNQVLFDILQCLHMTLLKPLMLVRRSADFLTRRAGSSPNRVGSGQDWVEVEAAEVE